MSAFSSSGRYKVVFVTTYGTTGGKINLRPAVEGAATDIRRAYDDLVQAGLALTLPLAVVLLLLGGGAVAMAVGGWRGRLSRGGRIGIHTPAAAESDAAFRVANRTAAPVFAGAGLVGVLGGVVILLLPLPVGAAILLFVADLIGVLALLLAGGLLGDRAARAVPVPARRPGASAACAGCACGSTGGCAVLTKAATAEAGGALS